jgi:Tfp pilus assembly protein PilF
MRQHTHVSAPPDWRGRLVTALGLAAAVFLAYLPALGGEFLWDDSGHVTAPALQSWPGLARIWFQPGATQQYYPLLHSLFWFEHRLWGEWSTGYHLANLLLHLVAAVQVIALARRLALPGAPAVQVIALARRLALPGAVLAGFLFALHPLAVESVAWITEQKNTLSLVLGLGAVLAYLTFDRERRWPAYATGLALFALALLSKTTVCAIPAILLVILWWQRGRLGLQRDVLPLLPWFATAAALGLTTIWVEHHFIGAVGHAFALGPLARTLLAGHVVWFYLGKLLWPFDLIFFYPHWTIDPGTFSAYACLLAALALTALLFRLARWGSRGPLATWLIFIGCLFPALGFFDVYTFRFSYVADHYAYLASIAFLLPLAAVLATGAARFFPAWPRLTRAAAFLLVAALGAQTFHHSLVFRSNDALYEDVLARNPDAWIARVNLGLLYANKYDRVLDAIHEYRTALRTDPSIPEAHANLGLALQRLDGHLPEAIAEFRAALQLAPDHSLIHFELAEALLLLPGHEPEAIAEYRTALRLQSNFPAAANRLGVALERTGHLPEAIAQYQAALRLKPDYAEAQFNLRRATLAPPSLPATKTP